MMMMMMVMMMLLPTETLQASCERLERIHLIDFTINTPRGPTPQTVVYHEVRSLRGGH